MNFYATESETTTIFTSVTTKGKAQGTSSVGGMLNKRQSTMSSSMVPFFLRWNHKRAYRTLVLR